MPVHFISRLWPLILCEPTENKLISQKLLAKLYKTGSDISLPFTPGHTDDGEEQTDAEAFPVDSNFTY